MAWFLVEWSRKDDVDEVVSEEWVDDLNARAAVKSVLKRIAIAKSKLNIQVHRGHEPEPGTVIIRNGERPVPGKEWGA